MSDLIVGRVVKLGDPDREEILAEIRGDFKKLNRLHSVAQRSESHGLKFASKKEANRFSDLKLAEAAGIVIGLQLQVTIPLVVNGVPIFPKGYRADFTYVERQQDKWQSWKFVIEDAKGVVTEVFPIKEKLVLAIYGIKIRRT